MFFSTWFTLIKRRARDFIIFDLGYCNKCILSMRYMRSICFLDYITSYYVCSFKVDPKLNLSTGEVYCNAIQAMEENDYSDEESNTTMIKSHKLWLTKLLYCCLSNYLKFYLFELCDSINCYKEKFYQTLGC